MSTSLRKRFGKRVKELRRAAGVSQEAFADHCGYARTYISRIERGGANPSLDAIETLAGALGVEEKELFKAPAPTAKAPPVLVPFAKDRSYFSPALQQPGTGTFAVGEKDDRKTFTTFEAALKHLNSMKPARWWRPNKSGSWGLVTEVRWGPLPKKGE